MIEDFKEIMKLDRIAIIVILFWSILLNFIFFLFFGVAIPEIVRNLVSGIVITYLLWKVYDSALNSSDILRSVLMFVIFYFWGSIIALVAFVLMVNAFIEIVNTSPLIPVFTFIIAMLCPYLILGSSMISHDYRVLLVLKRERMRIGLSISTALVTILYAILSFIPSKVLMISTLKVTFFIPFVINILGICFIDYYNLSDKESNNFNSHEY